MTTITIKESANRLGVSTATIRNWVKTNYLTQAEGGNISLQSLKHFQSKISGKEKLIQRANKSLKDSHDHNKIAAKFLDQIASSDCSVDDIGKDYERSLSDSYRNKEGVYYTPDEVVKDLFVIPEGDIQNASFCDPCCGSGNFIIRAIDLGFQPENIYGYDLDPVAVEITKKRLYKITGHKSENIRIADFLDVSAHKKILHFDYIYTNPPWGKKIVKEVRKMIASRVAAGTSTDTCSLFFFACLQHLADNGKLGLLLPESFFNIATFEDARIKALQLSIERLIDYGRVFPGLVTNAQSIILKKQPADPKMSILCNTRATHYKRPGNSFSCNPKSILNLYCNDEDARTLQYLMSIPYITLKNQALWGLGIVTGNNKKWVKSTPEDKYIPVYKGSDIHQGKLKEASSFISSNMSLYQQVAPIHIYEAKEKLVYKFISSRICFFYDNRQRFFLNSANILIPKDSFPIATRLLGQLLSSDFMNWFFSKIFNTHKILRGDLESLPIYSQILKGEIRFNEGKYLNQLNIEKSDHGTYRIKR